MVLRMSDICATLFQVSVEGDSVNVSGSSHTAALKVPEC